MSNTGFEYLKFISDEDIRRQADIYRQQICPEGVVPLDIFNIIEFDLDLEIRTVPGLRTAADTETVLLSDFKTILVDKDDFVDPRKENRLKYTLAHELGHICLHKSKTKNFLPRSVNEYIEIMLSVDESQYGRFEYQAYEFAGRLLVPKDKLIYELTGLSGEIENFLNDHPEGTNDLIPHLASKINDRFGVSTVVIEKRLEKEKIELLNL